MREDPVVTGGTTFSAGVDDNVVALPNLTSGRLADLLAAASGPAQEHELRTEHEARAAFRTVSGSWPAARRRLRRTPAVMAVTTVATMLVATTGLAAASQLPGPAGHAVQGILGSVGITSPPTTPAPAVHVAVPAPVVTSGPPALSGARRLGVTHGGCTVGGAANGATAGGIQTASCTIRMARPGTATAAAPATTATIGTRHAVTPVVHASPGGAHQVGDTGGGTTTGSGGGTPGGGSSRGGNLGGGSGTCGTGTGATGETASTTTTTEPGATTTTTDPSSTAAACGGHGAGHHHGTGSGATGGSTTTTTTTP